MKLIKCIIRLEKTEEVVQELQQIVSGMTLTEVRGHGRQKGHPLSYRGVEYNVTLLPKTMIDIVADDSKVDDVIDVLARTARTGDIGDGRIFVHTVEESYHVRSGFMDI